MTIASNGDSGKDRAIYVRVSGHEDNFWYVIEEKSSMKPPLSSANEVIGCQSEKDIVRRLPLPDSGHDSNNLAVLDSHMYLIGGDLSTHTHLTDDSLGYRHVDVEQLDLLEIKEWQTGGGKLTGQQEGGVAVGQDGYLYSIGPTIYRLHPSKGKFEQLPIPPQGPNPLGMGLLCHARLLGITKKKLYVYTEGGGVCLANAMLSFDLESWNWDELDDNFWGDWSPGVVLYEDRYLFSFGTRNPKLKPWFRRDHVEEEEDDIEVPGIYVFDLKRCEWLPEPIQGLPSDGTVIPHVYEPPVDVIEFRGFSPHLFHIRKDDDHHLALLWDSVGKSISSLTWSKFILDVCNTTDDIPRFYAHSLSRGYCLLDEKTGPLLNSAVGM